MEKRFSAKVTTVGTAACVLRSLRCLRRACGCALCCCLCWEAIFVFFRMEDINLVDPASSHTLVSKIKPCMSKYKHFCTVKLRMAHYISYSLLDSTLLLGYP
ncbi:hypothetical protein PF005_g31098 [Phytophthora fragariae]|uniref:Uncharacterized protein n=1 Tax=Phytophthora fragariae TaxID=53985 RepID=A0A6A3V825_9STRA|nr:hypothetical protein PF005_g31098 [Phytophthora fragariae]